MPLCSQNHGFHSFSSKREAFPIGSSSKPLFNSKKFGYGLILLAIGLGGEKHLFFQLI
jgi:hypothetical protein